MPGRLRVQAMIVGIGGMALLWPQPGLTQEAELDQEELYRLCSQFPFNSSCEGYEIPVPLDDRSGSAIACSFVLDDAATSDRCKLVVGDEQLTVYIEYGERLGFLDDQRGTRDVTIPFANIFAFNLRIWSQRLDAVSFFIGGSRYVLADETYSDFEGEFDPTSNSNERQAAGAQDFAEVEIDFLETSAAPQENQSNILQIAATEELGDFLRQQLVPVAIAAPIEPIQTQLLTPAPESDATLTPAAQVQQLLDTNTCIRCDLQGVDLRQADLDEANLEGANLANADLTESNLENAYLVGANLAGATLTRANLSGASLTLASLDTVDAAGINLEGASLQRATLQGATLTEGQFSGADLEGATLDNANLANADFSDSTRTRRFIPFLGIQRFKYYTSARRVQFRGANFNNANLEDAYFNNANLAEADLTDASLAGTSLQEANLTGAVVNPADLADLNLCDATLPDGTVSAQGCPEPEAPES